MVNIRYQIQDVLWGSKPYHQSVNLRYRLFRKPFNLQYLNQELQQEKNDKLFGAFLLSELIGFCAVRKLSDIEYQIRQMVVEPNYQKNGVGTLLIQEIENYLCGIKAEKIILDSRDESVNFYKKLGYKIEGEKFFKKTVYHWKMTKQICV